jgi:hypothetical protein
LCNPPGIIQDTIGVTLTKIGEYYVTYTLHISQDALNFYDSVHLVKNSDIKKLNYFLLEELKQTDFYGCYGNCQTCFDKLGTQQEFLKNFKTLYVADSVLFGTEDSLWVLNLYDSLYVNCQSIQDSCGMLSVCDEKLELLKMDVTPGGQYALYDSSYNLLELPINRLAMRSQIAFFTDEFGKRDSVLLKNIEGEDSLLIDVKDLNDSLFIQNWKDVWADSLVRLHPEYCFYLWCLANDSSYVFDKEIEDWIDGDSAIAKGWFDPNDYKALLDKDPFFKTGANGAALYNKMKKSLLRFSRKKMGFSMRDKNILEYIDVVLYCKDQSNGWNDCRPDSACRSRNREWFFYKQFYLNLKQKFYETARRTSTNPIFENCKNCQVGKDITGILGDITNTCGAPSIDDVNFSYVFTTPEACGDGGIPWCSLSLKNGNVLQTNIRATFEINHQFLESKDILSGYLNNNFCIGSSVYYSTWPYTTIDTVILVSISCLDTSTQQFVPPTTCNYNCTGGIYDPYDRDSVSFYVEYGNPNTAPSNTPQGYGNCQFYNVFDLQTGVNSSCKFFNVWVCVYDSTCSSFSGTGYTCGSYIYGQFGGTGYHLYPNETINLSHVAQGSTIQLTCDAIEVPNRFTIYDGANLVVSSGWMGFSNFSGPWGSSLNTPSIQNISFTKQTNTYTLKVETSPPSGTTDAWSVYINCAESGDSCIMMQEYVSSCPDDSLAVYYTNKERRYPEYVNENDLLSQLTSANPQQQSNKTEQLIADQYASNCDAQADYWMKTLKMCNNMDTADSIALRAALIDICKKGASYSAPYGTSSIPSTVSAPYHSFEEAIVGILGSGVINESCTSELLSMPYPYNRLPALKERVIIETDYDICQKLTQHRQAYIASGFTGSFHQYLENNFADSYTLDSTELDDMLNACLNCNGILKKDIVLPLIFDPLSRPCINCDSLHVAVIAFHNKFPNIDSTEDNYELLFTNYLNHRFGFALTYGEYRDFLYSCDTLAGFSGQLCNAPVSEELEADDNSCIREQFATALTNATYTYLAYIDSVRKDFKDAWLTKCMNVQPKLTMTANLYEYHYTLYYYDQSGNLVKTVPPEGVKFLSNTQIQQLQTIRNSANQYCSNNNSMVFTNGSVNFPGGTTASQLNVGTDPFTIECWINLTSYANQGILSNNHWTTGGLPYNTGYSLEILNSKLDLLLGENLLFKVQAQSPLLNSYISLNTWTHVAIQRSSINEVKMFINGNEVPVTYSSNNPLSGSLNHNNTDAFYTGASNRNGNIKTLTSGKLRHLRMYKRAMTSTEIRQNYMNYCGNPASEEGLAFWETFNEGIWTASGGNNYVYERVYSAAGVSSGTVAFETAGDNSLTPGHKLVTTYQYNSLNQVLQQYSPDGDTSVFFYDRLGRLTVSQNMRQKYQASYDAAAGRFSYTKYDALGRIKEVGEKSGSVTDIRTIDMLDTTAVKNWLVSGTDKQVTKTIYDNPVNILLQAYSTSRKRVVASIYLDNANDTEGDSSLYVYDILGNVKTLINHIKALADFDDINHKRKRRMDYDYDLVSGKVNMVSYSDGKGDQFYYKYQYDADNRVIRSYSSRDKLVWLEDASYTYYLHGPLARSELGQYNVQGVDYAYTLQGWLKGINSNALNPQFEIGRDGWSGTGFARVSRDVYSYGLGYYSGDYTPVDATNGVAMNQAVYQHPGNTDNTGRQLFNGNISNTTVALNKIENGAAKGYSYGYDQLNRLVYMNQHTVSSSTWSNTNIIINTYAESIAYDANGNILKYLRKGANVSGLPPDMDSLNYKYNYDVNGDLA